MQKVVSTLIASSLILCSMGAPALADGGGARSPGHAVETKEEPALRFYGLSLDLSLYDTTGVNAYNYFNSLDYWLMPAWQIGQLALKGTRFDGMMLTGRFIMNNHLAGFDEESFDPNSNVSGRLTPCSSPTPSAQGGTIDPAAIERCPYNAGDRRLTYSDVTLGLSVPHIATIPGIDVVVSPGISAVIPTSRASQLATLKTTLGASLGFARPFFDGKLRVSYSLAASKNFHGSTTAQAPSGGDSGNPVAGGDTTFNGALLSELAPKNGAYFNNLGGPTSASWGLGHIFRVEVAPIDKLSIGALYWLRQGFKYELSCTPDALNGSNLDTCANGQLVAGKSDSAITADPISVTQIFSLSVGYQALDWLNLSLGYFTVSPQRKPNGDLRQPFVSFDYSGFSSLSIGATVSIEKAAAKLF